MHSNIKTNLKPILKNTGHVKAIIGANRYQAIEEKHHKAVVPCGEERITVSSNIPVTVSLIPHLQAAVSVVEDCNICILTTFFYLPMYHRHAPFTCIC